MANCNRPPTRREAWDDGDEDGYVVFTKWWDDDFTKPTQPKEPPADALGAALTRTWRALKRTWRARAPRLFSRTYKARARRERRWARASRGAALLVAVAATYAVVHVLAARRRRREHVAATEFKAKVAPYLVEAPEL